MTWREFEKEYFGNDLLQYRQFTIDLAERITDVFEDGDETKFSTRCMAALYLVNTSLEIMCIHIADHAFWRGVRNELEKLDED